MHLLWQPVGMSPCSLGRSSPQQLANPAAPPLPPPPSCPQAGPNGLRIADLLDTVNAQASVRVSERDLRLALAQLDDVARVQQGVVTLRA